MRQSVRNLFVGFVCLGLCSTAAFSANYKQEYKGSSKNSKKGELAVLLGIRKTVFEK